MKEQELIEWIQLINSDNIGPVTFYRLLKKFGSAAEALKQLAARQNIFSFKDAAYELEKARKAHITVLTKHDTEYPGNFRRLNDAPPVLYVKGRTDIFNYPAAVSIVGSRNASVNGRKIAAKIAYDLTEKNVLVISGMARGIDSAAHKGALYAKGQSGTTVAVLGTGVDVPYPSENKGLYEQICAQGVVISEFLPGTKPQANNFPRRNRLVSALGEGVLVVEASLNSGSLITARLALEQNKSVFAVPGSPLEGRSSGCNKLIRESSAMLVENADDIIEPLAKVLNRQIKDYPQPDLLDLVSLQNSAGRNETDTSQALNILDKAEKNADSPAAPQADKPAAKPEEKSILALIPEGGIEMDELIRLSGNTVQTMVLITELELKGIISRTNGSRLTIKNRSDRKK